MNFLKKLFQNEQGSVPVILPATALIAIAVVSVIICITYKQF